MSNQCAPSIFAQLKNDLGNGRTYCSSRGGQKSGDKSPNTLTNSYISAPKTSDYGSSLYNRPPSESYLSASAFFNGNPQLVN